MDIIKSMKNTLGISCVEVYLLALCEEARIDMKSLFVSSFVEPQTVIEDFLNQYCNFTTYTGLERLQDVAARQGFANLQFFRDGESMLYFSPHRSLNVYAMGGIVAMLKGVKPDYKQSNFMPWRDDHYLLQYKNSIYDCYPPSEVENIDIKYYDGRNIRIEIVKTGLLDLGLIARPKTTKDNEEKIKMVVQKTALKPIEFSFIQENLPYLRDALLIVKTSRRRLNEILCSETIKEEIAELGKLIALLETCRLRGRAVNIASNLKSINVLEKVWRDSLTNG